MTLELREAWVRSWVPQVPSLVPLSPLEPFVTEKQGSGSGALLDQESLPWFPGPWSLGCTKVTILEGTTVTRPAVAVVGGDFPTGTFLRNDLSSNPAPQYVPHFSVTAVQRVGPQ